MASYDSEKAAEIHRQLHSHLPSDPALRVKALESLIVEKGLVASETIDNWIEAYRDRIGPKRGAARRPSIDAVAARLGMRRTLACLPACCKYGSRRRNG